jgi:transcriptional regulator of acetoin/glycerol metabolism
VTPSQSVTIEEIANTMSAAAPRAMRGLREVSDAVAELREAEMMLRGLEASQTIASEDRKSSNGENPRLAYRVDELAATPWRVNTLAAELKVSRRTIERRIKDGTLKAFKVVGITLIDAESVKALFEGGE